MSISTIALIVALIVAICYIVKMKIDSSRRDTDDEFSDVYQQFQDLRRDLDDEFSNVFRTVDELREDFDNRD